MAWSAIRGRLAEADILLACLVAWTFVALDALTPTAPINPPSLPSPAREGRKISFAVPPDIWSLSPLAGEGRVGGKTPSPPCPPLPRRPRPDIPGEGHRLRRGLDRGRDRPPPPLGSRQGDPPSVARPAGPRARRGRRPGLAGLGPGEISGRARPLDLARRRPIVGAPRALRRPLVVVGVSPRRPRADAPLGPACPVRGLDVAPPGPPRAVVRARTGCLLGLGRRARSCCCSSMASVKNAHYAIHALPPWASISGGHRGLSRWGRWLEVRRVWTLPRANGTANSLRVFVVAVAVRSAWGWG